MTPMLVGMAGFVGMQRDLQLKICSHMCRRYDMTVENDHLVQLMKAVR